MSAKPSLKNKNVYLFDGSQKINEQGQFDALNIFVCNKNLQQLVGAALRLRAQYLFAHNRFEEIHFTENDGAAYNFKSPYITINLKKYLRVFFSFCGYVSS